MPIVVECGCGKQFKAQDAHAGKRTKCPGCGADLLIPKVAPVTKSVVSVAPRKPVSAAAHPVAKSQANPLDDDALFDVADPAPAAPPPRRAPIAARPATGAPAQASDASQAPGSKTPAQLYPGMSRRPVQPRDKEGRGPAINIGGGWVTYLIIGFVLVGGIIFLFNQGPVKAAKQWETLGPQGESDVLTITTRGIRGHYASKGFFDDDFRKAPACDNVWFDEPVMMWSVPTVIEFEGRSSEGRVEGRYYPATREVECNARFDMQGTTVKITGRFKDGKFETEIGGKPAPELKPSGRPPRDDF